MNLRLLAFGLVVVGLTTPASASAIVLR